MVCTIPSPGLKDEITKTEEEMVKACEEYARIAAEVWLSGCVL